MMSETVVLDTFAIMAYWRDEAGADKVEALLRQAALGAVDLAMSAINVGEVAYVTERKRGENYSRQVLAFISEAPIRIYEATYARVLAADHLKARYPISYADAFAAALAEELNAVLLTGDPEFKAVEQVVRVHWLPREK
jgi:predicted nucleic acid-binding protein